MSSVDSLTVVCEKHQVLPTGQRHAVKELEPENKNVKVKHTAGRFRCSYPKTDPGDDVVQVLDFAFQQHHSGKRPALLVRMVQHHVEKVTQLDCDA